MMSDAVATDSKIHVSLFKKKKKKARELWHLTLTWDRCRRVVQLSVNSGSLRSYACILIR